MKYKLLKPLPNLSAGEVISSYGIDFKDKKHFFKRELSISEEIIEANPEWFAPFLFTTVDGVDIYKGDSYWYTEGTGLTGEIYQGSDNSYYHAPNVDRFSTKQAALVYLAKQKYPAGTKIKCLTNVMKDSPCKIIKSNYIVIDDDIWVNCEGINAVIYRDGKWAETIPQFEVGKWYSIQDESIIYFKHNLSNNGKVYGEAIILYKTGGRDYDKFWWKMLETIKEVKPLTDLSVIQPYLPDNHVDKVVNWKVGDIVVFIDNQGFGWIKNGSLAKVIKHTITSSFLDVEWLDKDEKYIDGGYYPNRFRKATEKEIISYYEKLGWVKGAKFKYKKDVYSVLAISNHSVQGALLSITDNVKSGYVSTLIKDCELIKQPELPKSWEELRKVGGFYIDKDSDVIGAITSTTYHGNKNLFKTEKQAESALVFAQLSQLVDKYNDGWVADWNSCSEKWCVVRLGNFLEVNKRTTTWHNLPFKSKELAKFSLKHHADLWRKYNELT